MNATERETRAARARAALDGLSVGDAFGERFFALPEVIAGMLEARTTPKPVWRWTDDTAMALSVVEILEKQGAIAEGPLADAFARRHDREPWRGYGHGAHRILQAIHEGEPWREVSQAAFSGTGSMGNGGAMRVAPVGAYFADDLDAAAEHGRRSALPTHAHPEGQAGAIAIAVAAATAWQTRDAHPAERRETIFDEVLARTPEGETRAGIARARAYGPEADIPTVVRAVGNGSGIISQDTVPFCIWAATRHTDDYVEALWQTVSGLGDRDTTCAIVGGIVAAGGAAPPPAWLNAREPLHGRKH